MLHTYPEFLSALEQYGFLLLGGTSPLPTLSALTQENCWHTDDAQTDPWMWRVRILEEKRGAYAHLLGGKPTFVSPAWYDVFRLAFSPAQDLPARYEAGLCDLLAYKLYSLFRTRPVWARHEFVAALGMGAIKPTHLERAITQLEREMFITSSGSAYKIGQNGLPYGWPSMEYTRVDAWMPDAFPRSTLTPAQAREKIATHILALAPELSSRKLQSLIGK